MGDVNDLIENTLNSEPYQKLLKAEKNLAENFAKDIEQAIARKDVHHMNKIIKSTEKNEHEGLHLVTVVSTKPMLALKLIQFLNARHTVSNRPRSILRNDIRSYVCSLKAALSNKSFSHTWNNYGAGAKPKILIKHKNPKYIIIKARTRLSFLYTKDELSVTAEFDQFGLSIKDELTKYSSSTQ